MSKISYINSSNRIAMNKIVELSTQLSEIAKEYTGTLAGIELHLAIAHLCASLIHLDDKKT